uniref:dUTP diphosphatase n=1 Tax=Rhinolophus ferrumequinum TaxID=59479 RepID=A0A671FJ16_RHIFE
MWIHFTCLSEHTMALNMGSLRAASSDLYSACNSIVPPMEKALVKADIQVALPSGCYGQVVPHSGSAVKHFRGIGAGITDEDYRGNAEIN